MMAYPVAHRTLGGFRRRPHGAANAAPTMQRRTMKGRTMDTTELCSDLDLEQEALDRVVAALPEDDWQLPTPSPGWTIAHQVAHLTYFDNAAATAITDPESFAEERDELFAAGLEDPTAVDDLTLSAYLAMAPNDLLEAWRTGRARLAAAAEHLGDGARVEWYGPSMSGRSFLTARLMEVWAHGQDIVDAVDTAGGSAEREATDRLRHIAHLGFVTRGWSYTVRGEQVPEGDVRLELVAPSGGQWEWGPADTEASVRGPAQDFCLVVTQRRHVDDTSLEVSGELATDWMRVAQAFAGGATEGPAPQL